MLKSTREREQTLGEPQKPMVMREEETYPCTTFWNLPKRKKQNQFNTDPPNSKLDRRPSRIPWLMVLKAAERLRKIN